MLCLWPYILLWIGIKHLATKQPQSTGIKKERTGKDVESSGRELVPKANSNELAESLKIPEPTASLLWITDEDLSKVEHAGAISIHITATLDEKGNIKVSSEEKQPGFYAEPSLIWSKMALEPNTDLEKSPMYYPAYSQFYPKTRYQYLNWLRDVTQTTNLSYVFLYFYGLERHLLIGNYDAAVDEVIRLLEHHKQKSFWSYACRSLIAASLIRKRTDVVDRAPFLLHEEIDEALALRIAYGTSMSPDDIITLAYKVGFTNKRYIKLHPALFKKNLQNIIDEFESEHGKLLSFFKLEDFKRIKSPVFANMSIPSSVRDLPVPQVIDDKQFKTAMYNLLTEAHKRTKHELDKERAVARESKKGGS